MLLTKKIMKQEFRRILLANYVSLNNKICPVFVLSNVIFILGHFFPALLGIKYNQMRKFHPNFTID